jgi:hypothetical protein
MKLGSIKPGSISDRFSRYFAENPDEELTLDDAALKFGIGNRKVLCQAILKLKRKGLIDVCYVIRRRI